ncbi:MAG: hypothetical protein A2096_03845 [Spirochaetes bacterium GWF1_41_5]|nr:MAG: hypothetical protein A2096_03845 [Spirochaetes bacterium GWF1_41_5]HBE00913.1 hypothetical protein [Spirochaetia bacterium]
MKILLVNHIIIEQENGVAVLNNSQNFEIQDAILSCCRERRFSVEIIRKAETISAMIADGTVRHYAGAVGIVPMAKKHLFGLWERLHGFIPCVSIFAQTSIPDAWYAGPDDDANTGMLLKALKDLNCKKIGFFNAVDSVYARTRFAAFIKYIHSYGLAAEPGWIFGFDPASGKLAQNISGNQVFDGKTGKLEIFIKNSFARLFKCKKLPDAVIFCKDYFAQLFMEYLREKKIKIPGRLIIAGYDNSFSLTGNMDFHRQGIHYITVNIDFRNISRNGIKLLEELIVGKKKFPPGIMLTRGSLADYNKDDTDPGSNNNFKNRVAEYIEKNYADEDILKPILEQTELSRHYFLSKFKKIFNQPFVQYINNLRLEKSVSAICSHKIPLTRIAFDAGFGTYQNFYQLFIKKYKCSPQKYKDTFL